MSAFRFHTCACNAPGWNYEVPTRRARTEPAAVTWPYSLRLPSRLSGRCRQALEDVRGNTPLWVSSAGKDNEVAAQTPHFRTRSSQLRRARWVAQSIALEGGRRVHAQVPVFPENGGACGICAGDEGAQVFGRSNTETCAVVVHCKEEGGSSPVIWGVLVL
ncbi:hypothetical protein BC628DRAFT_1358994 [Trametes gibbosa]|nr:hypothetical protein BC628DRAFT_1358994 [Trametes gibbosa]